MRAAFRASLTVALAFGLASPQAGSAQTLTFEGLQELEEVQHFYNGGTGSMGSSGVNYGMYFSDNAIVGIDADAGGSSNHANEPSPSSILLFLDGTSAVLNVVGGFTTGFSFYYTSDAAASVSVYDGLNGTGALLATLSLAANAADNGCTGDPTGGYCNWDAIGVAFAGTAMSVDFGGAANGVGFDNITINSQTPGTGVVPEPVSMVLLGTGLAGVAGARRRRRESAQLPDQGV